MSDTHAFREFESHHFNQQLLMEMYMKYRECVDHIDKISPADKDYVLVDVVNEADEKTVHKLKHAEIKDRKCIFVAGIVYLSNVKTEAVSFDAFKTILHEKEAEYADFECFVKSEDSNVILPLNRPYYDDKSEVLVLEADYKEFDKHDPTLTKTINWKAHFGNRTDAIKELRYVLKGLKMEFASSAKDIKFTKTSTSSAQLQVKVKGTATQFKDLRNGSYFLPDKDTYLKFGKW